jgi:hypothetical protein
MDWFVKAFLKSSLTWLAIGVTFGVSMAVHRPWAMYRTAHLHMNLLGFVTMMISGVAYHVIPRFTGHVLHSRRLAAVHVWLANGGLALLVAGFIMTPHGLRWTPAVLASGALMSAAGLYAFVFNLWRTIDGSRTSGNATPVTPMVRKVPIAEAGGSR